MKFERKNTIEGREVYENMDFKTTDSEIRNPDGSIVFSAQNIEIPDVIEDEEVTVVISQLGWIKFVKGKINNPEEIKYREGDNERFLIKAKTSDKLLIFGTNGHIYTLLVNLLPSGRTNGEPIRLLTDLPNQTAIVNVLIFNSDLCAIVSSNVGDGFIIKH